jgi:hypothetical protein
MTRRGPAHGQSGNREAKSVAVEGPELGGRPRPDGPASITHWFRGRGEPQGP